MNIIRVKDAQEGGKKAFEVIQEGMNKGVKTFGLATGSTPESLYSTMVASDLDFSDKISVNLDEYVGLSADDDQSYRYFMNSHLFDQKPFKETFVPDGKAADLDAECKRYDQVIEDHPIDIQVLGIGQNGHIGFNEPGTSFDITTHVVALTESTINANKRNFEKVEDVPTHALSMGIGSIMKSKKLILMAFGVEKADAVKGMIEGPVTEELPASILQKHDDVVVIIDEAAASKLK
ncbi:MAG TPA: glucosamine-6-phosphate deaminase [Tetragenococcus sp.]|nr:glucosamine-6-phosphate deaminase [Tetragenococcus sp.]